MVNLFEYQSYRDYLRAYYNEQKGLKKSFSYRSFSKKAGIQAPSFLFYVIEGKRNLTKNSLLKISGAIGHSRDEADYLALHLEQKFSMILGRPRLSRKPHFGVYAPIAGNWSKNFQVDTEIYQRYTNTRNEINSYFFDSRLS